MISLGIVNKKKLFTDSLKNCLKANEFFSICHTSKSITEFLPRNQSKNSGAVDVILLYHEEYCSNELGAVHYITSNLGCKVIVISDLIKKSVLTDYLKAGVSGFFSNEMCTNELSQKIIKVFENEGSNPTIGADVKEEIFNSEMTLSYNGVIDQINFTKRELQVLELICQEVTNKDIAKRLGLSVRTVEVYRKQMIDKTESKSIIGVLIYAAANHLYFFGSDSQISHINSSRMSLAV